jgi:hypothetical protein
MERFDIVSYTEKEVVLAGSEQIDKFYTSIHNEDAILLTWNEAGKKYSIVVITTTIVGKVKNGETIIKAIEEI